jgi:hypothetical protein
MQKNRSLHGLDRSGIDALHLRLVPRLRSDSALHACAPLTWMELGQGGSLGL